MFHCRSVWVLSLTCRKMEWVCFSFSNKHVNLPLDAGSMVLWCNILQLATTWILTGHCDIIVLVVCSVGYCEWVIVTFGTAVCLSIWEASIALTCSGLWWHTYSGDFTINQNLSSLSVSYDESGPGCLCGLLDEPWGIGIIYLILGRLETECEWSFCIVPYSTTFVIAFLISDLDVRSLWSLCLGFLGDCLWQVGLCTRWYRIYFSSGDHSVWSRWSLKTCFAKRQLPGCLITLYWEMGLWLWLGD